MSRNEKERAAFISDVPWSDEHPEALVIHCSYHPYQCQIQDFLFNGIGLRSFDRFAVPGGPQFLIAGGIRLKFKMAGEEQFRFLVDGHGIKRVVCIADAQCGWYKSLLGPSVNERQFKQCQVDDLKKTRQAILGFYPKMEVNLFYAFPNGSGEVEFEKIN